jgi:hypothetical protein
MASLPTQGETLSTEEIIHVVPDGHEPALYHWLYVKGGYVVKFNLIAGAVVASVKLPDVNAIISKVGDPEQKNMGSYHVQHTSDGGR